MVRALFYTLILLACARPLNAGESEPDKVFSLHATLDSQHGFWREQVRFARHVNTDLRTQLDTVWANNDKMRYVQLVSSLDAQTRQGAIIFPVAGYFRQVLEQADSLQIPFVTQVASPEVDVSGYPGGKYPNWLAEIKVDEEYAGYLLAKALIQQARAKTREPTTHLNVMALTGASDSLLTRDRLTGLRAAVAEQPHLTLYPAIPIGDWSSLSAELKAARALDRISEVQVIWCANDDIALGAINALKELGLQPGRDVIVGGIDNIPAAQKAIAAGEMHATVASIAHLAGWSSILLYDHLNGMTLADYPTRRMTLRPALVSEHNIWQVSQLFEDKTLSDIDFRQFSRTHRGNDYRYAFTLDALLKAMPVADGKSHATTKSDSDYP